MELVQSKDEERGNERYKVMKKEAKLAIATAKMTDFECLYKELLANGWDKKLYGLVKARKRRS